MSLGISIRMGIGGGGGVSSPPDGNPSNLTATTLSDTSVRLDWTIGSTNQNGHQIYYSTDAINYTLLSTVSGVIDTYTATGLTFGTTYYFKVRAYVGSLYSDYSNVADTDTFGPSFSSALVYLSGDIIEVGGSYYFEDKTSNNRDFLITNKDFPSDWTVGFPYKSAATISAPAGDAALIAADINNFLYDSGGTPNQIGVYSLFQDIDYTHKIFCRHEDQVVDSDGIETYEPRVIAIAVYSSIMSGADLTNCQTYYGVPTEDTTTMAWISPNGNDTTGNGSKALPYKTLSKIRDTAKANVYALTGDYSPSGAVTFSGATALNIIAVGRCTMTLPAQVTEFTVNRDLTFKGFDIIGTAVVAYVSLISKGIEYNRCKLTKTAGNIFNETQAGATTVTFKYCVMNVTSDITRNNVAFTDFTLDTCFGICNTDNIVYAKPIQKISIKNNNFSVGNFDVSGLSTLTVVGNKITCATHDAPAFRFRTNDDANITGCKVIGNDFHGTGDSQYIVYIGTITEYGYNGVNGLVFHKNKITNDLVGAGTSHTVFIGGGIDNSMKYNEIVATNGYGIVIKAGGYHYTTTDGHFSYNVIKNTQATLQAIYGRGVYGLIVSNNTITGFRGASSNIIHIDDNGSGQDNSMIAENNVITLGGNTLNYVAGANMTSRNNSINKNGFTLTQAIGANDDETSVVISDDGIPASRLDDGYALAGDNNIGLASDYEIPDNVTYNTQDANWQRGAVIL